MAGCAELLPADMWRVCFSFATGLELLRINVCCTAWHKHSAGPAAMLPQWCGFVELSDRLRQNIFRGASKVLNYGVLSRAPAIAILRRRCQYCRLHDCKYVNEFRPKERVCERCERERHLSTFKLVANPAAHGLTESEIRTLKSIERGTGKSVVTLYLASDIEAVLQARSLAGGGRTIARTGISKHSDSDSDSDSDYDCVDCDNCYDNPKVKKWKAQCQNGRSRVKAAAKPRANKRNSKLGRPHFLETSHLRRPCTHRREKNRNHKHSFTAHQLQQFDVATSGHSCLMLAD